MNSTLLHIASFLYNALLSATGFFSAAGFVAKLLTWRFRAFVRNDSLSDWVRLFSPYLQNPEKKSAFLRGFDSASGEYAAWIIEKLEALDRNNVLPFSKVFSPYECGEARRYAVSLFRHRHESFPAMRHYVGNLLSRFEFPLDGKAILDCGAFVGDTSIVLSDAFPDSVVHAFEPEAKNLELLRRNIAELRKTGSVVPVGLGVADFTGEISMTGDGAGAKLGNDSSQGEKISVTTIDEYVARNGIVPGMIKWDVEGAEYSSIVGAEKTIRAHRPVLLISIYHNGRDFFEIKPLLESWNLGYRFAIDRWHWSHPFADTILVCY